MMSEIKTSELLEILDKMEMFQGQRAGRELWAHKPIEVQKEDLKNFNRDIEIIRKYIESQNNVLKRIVDRMEERRNIPDCSKCKYFTKNGDECDEDCTDALIDDLIEIVKEEGEIE